MRKKKGGGGGGGANWMDTYGDMVTLLLCFFVLLYSMSTLDQKKFQALVESLNPSTSVTEDPEQPDGVGGDNVDSIEKKDPEQVKRETEEAMDQLYQRLKDYVTESNQQEFISVIKGQGYTFISFQNAVFFNGDSYVLLDSGKQVLDAISSELAAVTGSIDEIQVLGHTSQARTNGPNDEVYDRFLASNRATEVLLYLQQKDFIDPAKLVSVGYGQWRPVDTFETPEGRAANRRVELIITGVNPDGESGIEKYNSMRQNAQ